MRSTTAQGARPTVCLNMIVKNETKVIKRCLESLKSVIDYWVIVDTGSTDGTHELIRSFMHDVPGELHERTWKNFGHNRSEALALAKGKADYIFTIDADEVITINPEFSWQNLTHGAYLINFIDNGIAYQRCQLVSNIYDWRYAGVLHEYIYCEQAPAPILFPGINIVRFLDGARSSDPNKYKRDALVLENALLDEPDNARYLFYLAQSYKDANETDLAIRFYTKRAEKGGWVQEVWYSLYQVAQLMEKKGDDWAKVLQAYLAAYQYYPVRVGPLFGIMRHYMYGTGEFHLAHIFAKIAVTIPLPGDILFVEKDIYNWFVPLEYGVCAYWVGDHASAISINNTLLQRNDLPADLFIRAVENRKFSLNAIYSKRKLPLSVNNQITVVVRFHNPGHFLDNCIERLLQQNYPYAEFIFIDNGSTDDTWRKIPEHERIRIIREAGYLPDDQLLARHLPQVIQPAGIVYLLNGLDWLASDEILSEINDAYNERNCELLCSQFRFDDGRYGNAMPFASSEDLKGTIQQQASLFSISLTGELLQRYCSHVSNNQGDADASMYQERDLSAANVLVKLAGFNQVQFEDSVWLIKSRNTNVGE